jgi:hypothetical protein
MNSQRSSAKSTLHKSTTALRQKRQNQGPRWKSSRQFIDHPRKIIGLTRQDRHVRSRIDAVEQVVSRRGPVTTERTAYPQAIPFDLVGPVRADQKADIVWPDWMRRPPK